MPSRTRSGWIAAASPRICHDICACMHAILALTHRSHVRGDHASSSAVRVPIEAPSSGPSAYVITMPSSSDMCSRANCCIDCIHGRHANSYHRSAASRTCLYAGSPSSDVRLVAAANLRRSDARTSRSVVSSSSRLRSLGSPGHAMSQTDTTRVLQQA